MPKTYTMTMCTDGSCSRAYPCAECRAQSGRVMKDGEGVRTRMMMMDSVQREIAAQPTTRPGQATLDAMKTAGERTQAFTDHFLAKHAERQAGLQKNGYHRSLPDYHASDADTAGGAINEFAESDMQKQALENVRKRARERQKHGYPLTAYEQSLL